MNIEKGDYFIITRGREYTVDTSIFSSIFGGGEDWKQSAEPRQKHYDRSFHGCVFQALAVEHLMVAAKFVHGRCSLFPPVISLNVSELEVMTVGKDYVRALGVEVPA